MKYRVGWPAWQIAARMGARMVIQVNVMFDPECKRYLATSRDIDGLVVEAGTLDELAFEVRDCVRMLLEDTVLNRPGRQPMTDLHVGLLPQAA